KEPEILKKSNAKPYTMQESMIIHKPSAGFPKANNPNRSTQAIMAKSMTLRIPKRFKKKGIAKIKRVSEIWEMDIMMVERSTISESAYLGKKANSLRKTSP